MLFYAVKSAMLDGYSELEGTGTGLPVTSSDHPSEFESGLAEKPVCWQKDCLASGPL